MCSPFGFTHAVDEHTHKGDAPYAFWRLKRIRAAHRLTLEDLAARTGLTKSFLSKVERGLSTPSIASAIKLADAFGLSLAEVFGTTAKGQDYTLVRRAERQPFNRRGQESGHRYEAIMLGGGRGLFEAFVDTPPFAVQAGFAPAEHRGQEMLHVLKGRVDVHFPHRTLRLARGDSLVFDARVPHYLLSVAPHPAQLLVVVTEPAAESGDPPPTKSRRGRARTAASQRDKAGL
jgi:transcriptional regulator with XRE-family HTH domain